MSVLIWLANAQFGGINCTIVLEKLFFILFYK